MTAEDLKRRPVIYVENVVQGMQDYKSTIVSMSGAEACEYFCSQRILRGGKGVWVDFYLFRLRPEETRRVLSLLNPEEGEYLRELEKKVRTAPDPDSDIIFEADESLLQIITKLNEKEALFSTVYLEPAFQDGKAYTWWGNYGKQYVVFESVE